MTGDMRFNTSARFYREDGSLIVVDGQNWFLRSNAIYDARDWLENCPEDLNPCNISVRGPDGRFIKWKN